MFQKNFLALFIIFELLQIFPSLALPSIEITKGVSATTETSRAGSRSQSTSMQVESVQRMVHPDGQNPKRELTESEKVNQGQKSLCGSILHFACTPLTCDWFEEK
ncbi:hypothetical protein PGT21_029625 [Puccinia graminis f. sp. tritici]|uniref:Uncharacterized protein n=1 Tax=Puccinia graminis f. sp. tritici TaxID=56615 RepID=A0A5B0SAY7_PUCGR|nr:hypothetical protein PGT21_029625 [Puccinia graminis f. sp. tritici]KAA1135286.1 hypothetical protein PGTUg99_025646 [Puccinia graminis f. sp. tritici]